MSTRTMNDYEVMAILSHLVLKNKLRLMSVSKQFKDCVERLLKSQKTLDIRLRSLARRARRSEYNEDIVIYEKIVDRLNRVIQIVLEDVKNRYEATLMKFENLKTITFTMNTNSASLLEWINELFPNLVSIKVRIAASNDWTQNNVDSIVNYFGSKCETIEVRRYRNFDRLETSGLFRVPALKSLTLLFNPNEDAFFRMIRQLPPKISDLTFDFLIGSNINEILNLFNESNVKHIKRLKTLFTVHSDGNFVLKFLAKHMTQLEDLHLVCGSIDSLTSLKYAKQLKSLKINPMSASVIDIKHKKTISQRLKRLKIYGNCLIRPEVIASMDTYFPSIQSIVLNNLKIYCVCEKPTTLCLTCNQTFLANCSQLIHKFEAKGNGLSIELVNENFEPYHQIILQSVFGLYFDCDQSFRLNVKSYRTEYVCVILLESANLLAYRRPDLSFKVIVNQQLAFNLDNFTKILAQNLSFEFTSESFDAMDWSEDKFICMEMGANRDQVVVYFGNKNSFIKMFSIQIYI